MKKPAPPQRVIPPENLLVCQLKHKEKIPGLDSFFLLEKVGMLMVTGNGAPDLALSVSTPGQRSTFWRSAETSPEKFIPAKSPVVGADMEKSGV